MVEGSNDEASLHVPAGRYVAGGVNVPLPAQASKETVQDGSSSGRYLAAYPRTHSG